MLRMCSHLHFNKIKILLKHDLLGLIVSLFSWIISSIEFCLFEKHTAFFSLLLLLYCIFSIKSPQTHLTLAVTTLWSVSISPFTFLLNPSTPSPSPTPQLSGYSLSMSLFLFCLLVQFVHQILYMRDVIRYLPLT